MAEHGWAVACWLAHRVFVKAMRLERRAARLYDWASTRKARAWADAHGIGDTLR